MSVQWSDECEVEDVPIVKKIVAAAFWLLLAANLLLWKWIRMIWS